MKVKFQHWDCKYLNNSGVISKHTETYPCFKPWNHSMDHVIETLINTIPDRAPNTPIGCHVTYLYHLYESKDPRSAYILTKHTGYLKVDVLLGTITITMANSRLHLEGYKQ
jgi:hypothetical protein